MRGHRDDRAEGGERAQGQGGTQRHEVQDAQGRTEPCRPEHRHGAAHLGEGAHGQGAAEVHEVQHGAAAAEAPAPEDRGRTWRTRSCADREPITCLVATKDCSEGCIRLNAILKKTLISAPTEYSSKLIPHHASHRVTTRFASSILLASF